MEERKNQQLTKKVRFDLNDEVFLIPSKWDRLSKCKTLGHTNLTRSVDGLVPKHRSRTVVERRNKGKQNGHRKMPNFSAVASGKLVLTPESNTTTSDRLRPNTSPNKSNPRKTSRQKVEGFAENTNGRSSTSPVEARLKLYHRPPQELPRLDLVLPKIPYTPDLKKAIEKALQRSRSKPTLENGLNSGTLMTQEKKPNLFNTLPQDKAEKVLGRRLSDSSILFGDEKPTEYLPTNGEGSTKFSELSSINIDGWSPFSAWSGKDSAVPRSDRTPPITRGRSMSSLIPSSILY